MLYYLSVLTRKSFLRLTCLTLLTVLGCPVIQPVALAASEKKQDTCLDANYSLPRGSYLETLEKNCCHNNPENIIQCVREKASYTADNDILWLKQTGTILYKCNNCVRHSLPSVMGNACQWINEGYDIVLARDEIALADNQAPLMLAHGLLLTPPEKLIADTGAYIRFKFGLLMLISYAFDWQDKQLRLSTALLPGNYKIQLHFNGNLVAVDETSDESQSLTLINGYSCLKEKLDIVAVKDSLYCIDLAEATALSMGKFLNQETRPSFALLVFATLIQNSPLTDAQMLRMFRILNRYMANTGKPKYLGSLEQQHNSSGIVSDSFFYRRSLLSHLYMPELEYLFVKGVYSEIVKAGGGFSENNMSHHLYMSGFYTHLIILAALNYYATSGSINRIKIRAWFLIIALACTGSYAFLKWIHLSR